MGFGRSSSRPRTDYGGSTKKFITLPVNSQAQDERRFGKWESYEEGRQLAGESVVQYRHNSPQRGVSRETPRATQTRYTDSTSVQPPHTPASPPQYWVPDGSASPQQSRYEEERGSDYFRAVEREREREREERGGGGGGGHSPGHVVRGVGAQSPVPVPPPMHDPSVHSQSQSQPLHGYPVQQAQVQQVQPVQQVQQAVPVVPVTAVQEHYPAAPVVQAVPVAGGGGGGVYPQRAVAATPVQMGQPMQMQTNMVHPAQGVQQVAQHTPVQQAVVQHTVQQTPVQQTPVQHQHVVHVQTPPPASPHYIQHQAPVQAPQTQYSGNVGQTHVVVHQAPSSPRAITLHKPEVPGGLSFVDVVSKVRGDCPTLYRIKMKGDLARLPMKAIKTSLEACTGVPVDRQVLEKDGFFLADDLTGSGCHLVNGSVLTLTLATPSSLVEQIPVSAPQQIQQQPQPQHDYGTSVQVTSTHESGMPLGGGGGGPSEERTFYYTPPQRGGGGGGGGGVGGYTNQTVLHTAPAPSATVVQTPYPPQNVSPQVHVQSVTSVNQGGY